MADANPVEMATRRLSAALDGLEAALERRRGADQGDVALAEQVSSLGADRSRLAAELDQQAARAQKLEATTREISQRLDAAMEAVQTVVDAHEN
ncbi:MAG: DUF4164 domain-containing protein [Rhizobiales bacterium]|nr:DUF4164 domain-containing protein [Hyphomicrobiales bacterium]